MFFVELRLRNQFLRLVWRYGDLWLDPETSAFIMDATAASLSILIVLGTWYYLFLLVLFFGPGLADFGRLWKTRTGTYWAKVWNLEGELEEPRSLQLEVTVCSKR